MWLFGLAAKSLKSYSKSTSIKAELGVSRVQTRVESGRDASTPCPDFFPYSVGQVRSGPVLLVCVGHPG